DVRVGDDGEDPLALRDAAGDHEPLGPDVVVGRADLVGPGDDERAVGGGHVRLGVRSAGGGDADDPGQRGARGAVVAHHDVGGVAVLPGDDEPALAVHGHARGDRVVGGQGVDGDRGAGGAAVAVVALGPDVVVGEAVGVGPDGDRGAVGRAGVVRLGV